MPTIKKKKGHTADRAILVGAAAGGLTTGGLSTASSINFFKNPGGKIIARKAYRQGIKEDAQFRAATKEQRKATFLKAVRKGATKGVLKSAGRGALIGVATGLGVGAINHQVKKAKSKR